MFEDRSGQMTLRDVLNASDADGWSTPAGALRLSGDSAWWLRIRINVPDAGQRWLLAFPTTAIRDASFFGPYGAHRLPSDGDVPQATGLRYPHDSRPMGMERITFPLSVPEEGEYTVWIRIQNTIAQDVTPSLWDVGDYVRDRQHKRLFDGMVYGILVALLVYNLTLAAVFRDRTYVLYVATCGAALLSIATFNGHSAHYLWPDSPWWTEHSYVIWPALWVASSALFARDFLSTPSTGRRVDGLVLSIALAALVSLVVGATGWTGTAQTLNQALSVLGIALITAVAVGSWRQGFSPAGWYLLAQITLFVTVIGVVIVGRGWWDAPFMLANGLQIGIAAEMVVFAIALSARIRRIQRDQAVLSRRAAHLALAALTDPLTGLANRRGLTESAQTLLAEPGRHAVLLFDLDRFKPINDNHGHETGDEVLVEMGRRLTQRCRETDVAARLGGDEFVVLLGNCPERPTLDAMVQRFCDALDAPMLVGGRMHQITASVGVALAPDQGRQLQPLLRLADQAMYAAKTRRSRLAFADGDAPAAQA